MNYISFHRELLSLWKFYQNLPNHYLYSYLSGSASIIYVANLASKGVTVNLYDFDKTLPTHLTLLIRSLQSAKSEG